MPLPGSLFRRYVILDDLAMIDSLIDTPAKVKAARLELGLTQEELAKALGLKSGRTIRRYESKPDKGRELPSSRKISGPIQIAIKYLLCNK